MDATPQSRAMLLKLMSSPSPRLAICRKEEKELSRLERTSRALLQKLELRIQDVHLAYHHSSPAQELLGLEETPRLAQGRAPTVCHLLAPNGRPAQVTSDLAGFWRGSYAELRKALRGRYPKHDWPEQPHLRNSS